MKATHRVTRHGVTKDVHYLRPLDHDEDQTREWCKVLVLDAQPYAMLVRETDLVPLDCKEE